MSNSLACSALAVLIGSSGFAWAGDSHAGNALEYVQVSADFDANASSATELDLVFAYDPEVDAALPATSAEWFRDRQALTAAFQDRLEVTSLQLPPGTLGFWASLPSRGGEAVRVLVYAGYLTSEGQEVGDLTDWSCAHIALAASAPRYEGCD